MTNMWQRFNATLFSELNGMSEKKGGATFIQGDNGKLLPGIL